MTTARIHTTAPADPPPIPNTNAFERALESLCCSEIGASDKGVLSLAEIVPLAEDAGVAPLPDWWMGTLDDESDAEGESVENARSAESVDVRETDTDSVAQGVRDILGNAGNDSDALPVAVSVAE